MGATYLFLHSGRNEKTRTTTEWATLIGPKAHRVWVGTDIPGAETPGKNQTDRVVFRDSGKRPSARLWRERV